MPPRNSSTEPEKIRVVPTNPDPIASLDRWGVVVEFAGVEYEIPPLDAAAWLKVLLPESLDLEDIFPGLAGPVAVAEVNMALFEGRGTDAELVDVIKAAVEEASGRRWWITLRLCRTIRSFWERVGGELAAAGVTPFGVPLAWWLDAAFAVCFRLIRDTEPKQLTQFTQALATPPPEEGKKIDEVANSQAFLAAMRQAGGM